MSKLKIWIEATRVRTLPVSVSGVLVGVGFALWRGCFDWVPALLCFVFAVLAQIVSNLANEYYDYLKGTDKVGRVGPRRGVTEGDISPTTLRNVTFVTLALACAVGCCLLPYGEWWLFPAGVVIAIFALAYSTGPYPLSYHGLGELTVFIFFGVVPVNLTYYVQAGNFHPFVVVASATVGFMAVNVLLVNNYRDADDDKEAGKRTSVVIFGRTLAAYAYLVNGYAAIGMLMPLWVGLTYLGHWYVLIIPILYLVMHTRNWRRMVTSEGAALNPLLGATARTMLVFTLLLTAVLAANPY